MPAFADALSEDRAGTVIALEVSAGAKQDTFPSGYNAWRKAIGCRITAPATEGRANKAIVRLVAAALGVPASSVSIISGQASTQKRIRIVGLGTAEVLSRLGQPPL